MTLVSSTAAFSLRGTSFSESVTVSDSRGACLAADFLVKLSNNFAYAVFGPQAAAIEGKTVEVEKGEEGTSTLKLLSITEERPDRRLLPVYIQFHFNPKERYADSHTLDALAENSLGRQNLDLKKNVTADFFDEVPAHARDESGFLVSDKQQFSYLTFSVEALKKQLSPDLRVAVSRFSSSDMQDVIEFDSVVSGFQRAAYVEEMVRKTSCVVARDDGRVVGVLFGGEKRVFALYAENRAVSHSLLKTFLEGSSMKTVSFFSPVGLWQDFSSSRRVVRRHTRVVPSAIDWTVVYAFNAGTTIV